MKCVSRLFVLSVAMVMAPISAQAGFEWVPPQEAQQPTQQMAPQQMPAPAQPAVPEMTSQPPMVAPMQAEELVPPAVAMPAQPVKREGLYETLEGFGTDIPLAFAVKQIIPEDYTYAFDVDVDMSERISWSGGKPWITVLDEALAEHGLIATLSGNAVRVSLQPVGTQAMHTPQTHKPQKLQHVSMKKAEPKEPVQHHKPAMKTEQPVIKHGPEHSAMRPSSEKEDRMAGAYPGDKDEHKDMDKDMDKFSMFKKAEVKDEPKDDMAEEQTAMPAPGTMGSEPVDLQRRQKPKYSDHQNVSEGVATANAQAETIVKPMPIAVPEHDVMPSTPQDQQFMKYDGSKVHYWTAAQGADIRALLTSWSNKVGVTLYWGARSDYELKMPVELHGTYPEAVQAVLETYGEQTPRPWGRFHPNLADGKSILIVQNYPDY